MTTNQIKLDCGATVVIFKVCGRYSIKAVQDCTNKNILSTGRTYRKIREVRAFMVDELSKYDWTKRLKKSELKARLPWYETTMQQLYAMSCL